MIADKDDSAGTEKLTPEEKSLLERSIAPTVRDLRAAAKDLFAIIVTGPDSVLSNLSRASRRLCLPKSAGDDDRPEAHSQPAAERRQ